MRPLSQSNLCLAHYSDGLLAAGSRGGPHAARSVSLRRSGRLVVGLAEPAHAVPRLARDAPQAEADPDGRSRRLHAGALRLHAAAPAGRHDVGRQGDHGRAGGAAAAGDRVVRGARRPRPRCDPRSRTLPLCPAGAPPPADHRAHGLHADLGGGASRARADRRRLRHPRGVHPRFPAADVPDHAQGDGRRHARPGGDARQLLRAVQRPADRGADGGAEGAPPSYADHLVQPHRATGSPASRATSTATPTPRSPWPPIRARSRRG